MKKLLHLCLFLLHLHTASAQTVWPLQACIDYALKNNVSVKEAGLQKRLAALSLSQAKAARWPSLSFGGSSGYRFGLSENPTTGTLQSTNFFSTGFSLSAGVDLFNWFEKRHGINAANAETSVAEKVAQKAQNDVVMAVQTAYLQALLAKELVRTARLQVQQSLTLVDAAARRVAVGAAAEPDLMQVRLQSLTDSSALLSAEENRQRSLLQLKAILAVDAAAELEVEAIAGSGWDTVLETPENTYAKAAAALPETIGIGYQLEASAQRLKAAKATRLPSLSLYGSVGSNYVNIPSAQSFVYVQQQATGAKVLVNGISYDVTAPSYQAASFGVTPVFRQLQTNFGQNIGLALNFPIANGKVLATAIKREEINRLQLLLQKDRLLQELKTTVYTAYTEALSAQNRWRQNKKMAAEAERLFAAAQKRYAVNLLSTQDLLIQKNKWQNAEVDLLVARYEMTFKAMLLDFYRGAAYP